MASRRVTRIALIGLGLIVLLGILAFVVVRQALDPASLRAMAESRLSAALGRRVTIGKMDVALFPSPAVTGGDIRVGDAGQAAAPSIGLQSLRIVPKLSSVFSKPIVVDEVDIGGLSLTVRRDKDGRWVLPVPTGSAPADASGASGVDAASAVNVGRARLSDGSITIVDDASAGRPARSASIRQIAATMRLEGGTAHLDALTASLGGSTIAGRGTASRSGLRFALEWRALEPAAVPEVFALLGMESPAGLSIAGDRPLTLDIAVDAQGTVDVTGRLAASSVRFGTFALAGLESPLRFAANRLTLDPLTFTAYGGQQRGSLSADLIATPAAWTVRSAIDRVDVNQLLSANTSAKDKLSGTGRLKVDLRGATATPIERTVTGTIEAAVTNGVIRNFPLLASLNSALKLTGASDKDLGFESLTGSLHVADARATTNDLVARSGDLTLRAAGTMGFDQSLDLRGTATFTRAKSDDLVRQLKHLGGLRNPQGEIEVPLGVTGTATTPVFSIDASRMLGRAAEKEVKRQLNRGLKKLIKIR